jgi:hypothetical protein
MNTVLSSKAFDLFYVQSRLACYHPHGPPKGQEIGDQRCLLGLKLLSSKREDAAGEREREREKIK